MRGGMVAPAWPAAETPERAPPCTKSWPDSSRFSIADDTALSAAAEWPRDAGGHHERRDRDEGARWKSLGAPGGAGQALAVRQPRRGRWSARAGVRGAGRRRLEGRDAPPH